MSRTEEDGETVMAGGWVSGTHDMSGHQHMASHTSFHTHRYKDKNKFNWIKGICQLCYICVYFAAGSGNQSRMTAHNLNPSPYIPLFFYFSRCLGALMPSILLYSHCMMVWKASSSCG